MSIGLPAFVCEPTCDHLFDNAAVGTSDKTVIAPTLPDRLRECKHSCQIEAGPNQLLDLHNVEPASATAYQT